VDFFAPDVDIRSSSIYQDGTEVLSGTSKTTPHISGLALYLKALEGNSLDLPSTIGSRIKELATQNVVIEPGIGSPNLLAYNGNGRR
jgi:oryzin